MISEKGGACQPSFACQKRLQRLFFIVLVNIKRSLMSQIGHQHFKVVIKTNCLQHPSPSMVNDINLGVDYLKIDASLFQSKGSNEILNAKIYQINIYMYHIKSLKIDLERCCIKKPYFGNKTVL